MSLALPSPMLVNKRELARHLGVSLPTIGALIDRYPDFPIVERGTNGVEWQFDLAAVATFVKATRDAEAASKAARDEQLAQLILPLDLQPQPPEQPALSFKDQLAAADLRAKLRKEAIEAGDLVRAAEIEDAYTTLMAAWRSRLREFVRQIGREQAWPDEVVRQYEARLADLQENLVDQAPALLATVQPADARRLA